MKTIVGALLLAAVAVSAGEPAAAPAAAPRMETLYLVFLKRGPKTDQGEKERETIQAAHMANIGAMWKAKKLVVAGPIGEDGELRGIFVFRVGSRAEAEALVASDPAVKAGRLVGEIHEWWVEKGAMAPAGEYCRPQS